MPNCVMTVLSPTFIQEEGIFVLVAFDESNLHHAIFGIKKIPRRTNKMAIKIIIILWFIFI